MLTHVEALERFASRSASALSRRCGTGCGAARCASANAIRSCSREDTTLSKRAVCSLSRVAALPSSTAVPTAAFRSASSASDTVAAREDQDAIHSRARLNAAVRAVRCVVGVLSLNIFAASGASPPVAPEELARAPYEQPEEHIQRDVLYEAPQHGRQQGQQPKAVAIRGRECS